MILFIFACLILLAQAILFRFACLILLAQTILFLFACLILLAQTILFLFACLILLAQAIIFFFACLILLAQAIIFFFACLILLAQAIIFRSLRLNWTEEYRRSLVKSRTRPASESALRSVWSSVFDLKSSCSVWLCILMLTSHTHANQDGKYLYFTSVVCLLRSVQSLVNSQLSLSLSARGLNGSE